DDRTFGPILFSQYTLSGGTLKMTVQMPPIGPQDSQIVGLQLPRGDKGELVAESKIHPTARTATFRIENWDDKLDVPYSLVYALTETSGKSSNYFYNGAI